MTQRTIPQMVSQGSGHIVNISTSLVDHADSTTNRWRCRTSPCRQPDTEAGSADGPLAAVDVPAAPVMAVLIMR
jgi:hypothetical protein